MPAYDVVVVGAGFAGSTAARVLADAGRRILILEQRTHLAGNAADGTDAAGVRIHHYGPHIFHTGSPRVVDFLSRFTDWHPYEHRVLARSGDELYPLPINRTTLEKFFATELADEQAAADLLARLREPQPHVTNSHEAVLDQVGPELFDAFFRHYTRKQWQRDARNLDASICRRIPVRTSRDDRYFTHPHQAMPANGYAAMFAAMLDHPLIDVQTATAFSPSTDRKRAPLLIYTGPLDTWFDKRLGPLPYRSLRFEHSHIAHSPLIQPVGTINECNPTPEWTRTTEFRHLTGQMHSGTSIVREFPSSSGDPYYPVLDPDSQLRATSYRNLANKEPGVSFVGRLAEFRYYDMDQACAAALTLAKRLIATT